MAKSCFTNFMSPTNPKFCFVYWHKGWQSRWFVLYEDNVLHYYSKKEEVDGLSKGSINVSAAKISRSNSDKEKFSIVSGNGSQTLYLKAETETERQRWIILLGACKANFVRLPGAENAVGPVLGGLGDTSVILRRPRVEIEEKLMEIRTMRDILLKQISDVRAHSKVEEMFCSQCGNSLGGKEEHLEGQPIREDLLLQDVTLFNASSEQFIRTVDSCIEYFYGSVDRKVSSSSSTGSRSRGVSSSGTETAGASFPNEEGYDSDVFYDAASGDFETSGPADAMNNSKLETDKIEKKRVAVEDSKERKVVSFFSKAPVKFQELVLEPPENGIDTRLFLDACEAIIPILGKDFCVSGKCVDVGFV